MQTNEAGAAEEPQWFVLRDLKRPNSKNPAYKVLPAMGFETFTPMHWVLRNDASGGKRRLYLPFIPSMLFAKSVRSRLDGVVESTGTLQYRFVKGAAWNTPMTVPVEEMERFMRAVNSTLDCIYYTPTEITPDMLGREVMIVGGALDGTTGRLLKRKGSKRKRLVISLRDMLVASVEVEPDYIQFV